MVGSMHHLRCSRWLRHSGRRVAGNHGHWRDGHGVPIPGHDRESVSYYLIINCLFANL
jgi:hypothetical protein